MRMRLSDRRVWHGLWVIALILLMTAPSALAQATSTFNGRILDQGDAVLPGVTVTITNQNTGVVRTTVTNEEGLYFLPGLEPGVYRIATELPGFAPSTRDDVTLGINATLSLDFKLGLSGVAEAITVTGSAPLIEVTQSKVASTIEATELQNLPMISRTVSGMLTLLPGATPVVELHRTKTNVGTVSFAGSSGANVIPSVDGADNRDNHYGGPLMSFSTESLEQFQLASSQFTAADGRTGGAAVTIVTKSGTNVLHGSAFVFERDKALTSKDFFTEQSNAEKAPFSRQQFGGSIGGPIVRNRAFFFAAVEQWLEDTGRAVPDSQYNELEALVTATRAGHGPDGAGESRSSSLRSAAGSAPDADDQVQRSAEQQSLVDGTLRHAEGYEGCRGVGDQQRQARGGKQRDHRAERRRAAQLGDGQQQAEPDHRPGEPHEFPGRLVEQHHRRALHQGLSERRHLSRHACRSRRW